MAIVTSSPGADGKFQLYDIPDADLGKYAISADKAATMFPKKDNPTRDDAQGVVTPSSSGDVQGYSGDICYIYQCYYNGYCEYVWWYC
jgi:hypothetical protein